MKTSIDQKIKIGLFTIAGILLFVIAIFLIGSKQNMFGSTFMIYGTFRNVGGLDVGNNIRFAGINVGTVEDIQIVSDTIIRVDMRMKKKVKPFLKADALATIGSDGLMGDKLITISSGSANEVRLLTGGSRITTTSPVDFDIIVSKFANVADNAEVITHELAGMAVQIRKGNGTISKLLYTDDLSRSLEGTASNAEKITGSLAGIASEIKSGRGSLGSLVYTDSLSNGLEKAVTTGTAAMVTIREAADGFSENMKALQGNYFFRGYYKRKAQEDGKNPGAQQEIAASESLSAEMSETELKDLIGEAEKALAEKRKKK
jgi:phospholipid/cholesterol/gamma-HCH transport system substrate-binding protein